MSRSHRSVIAFLTAGVVLVALVASWGGVQRATVRADDSTADANPLILVGQKPRIQGVFSGEDATFTVAVTNTGTASASATAPGRGAAATVPAAVAAINVHITIRRVIGIYFVPTLRRLHFVQNT